MTSEELADIRAYVAERAAARARAEHIDSDERREAALLGALDEATRQRDEARVGYEAAVRDLLAEIDRVLDVERVLEDVGCDCACDHASLEEHEPDCHPCVACRVADALWPEAGR
jgi:hypothetical protein